MLYVADTHAFLWYLTASPRLSQRAKRIFDSVDAGEDTLVIPAIVLVECISVLEKKRVALKFEAVIAKIAQANNFILSELTWGLILETYHTKGLRDLHDRVIVATARLFDVPLISKDRIVRAVYQRIIW